MAVVGKITKRRLVEFLDTTHFTTALLDDREYDSQLFRNLLSGGARAGGRGKMSLENVIIIAKQPGGIVSSFEYC